LIEEEKNQLKKDRRVYDRQNDALKDMPNRKERDQIEKLAKQYKDIEENNQIKEQRNKLTIERLRKQIVEAKKINEELVWERNNLSVALKEIFGSDADNQDDNNVNNSTSENSLNNLSSREPNDGFKSINISTQNLKISNKEEVKEEINISNLTHSPQFGVRSNKFEEINSQTQARPNNFIKPSFNDDSGDENVADEENDYNDIHEGEDDDIDPSRYNMVFLDKYHSNSPDNKRIIQENISNDGKTIRWYANQK